MRATSLTWSLMVAMPFCSAAAADAAIVVDHSANRTGGWFSDTQNLSDGGTSGQRVADDFQLAVTATIRHVTWWGVYNDTVPSLETMRIRFYDARPGDGLPGEVLSEEIVVNPSRTATGVIIPGIPPGTSGTAPEYVFEADLAAPFSLGASTPYWLEIVQLADTDTGFFWRGALFDNSGVAYLDAQTVDWTRSVLNRDTAFQLSTIPEPSSFVFFALSLGYLTIR